MTESKSSAAERLSQARRIRAVNKEIAARREFAASCRITTAHWPTHQ
jgi:hypothetical protein